MPKEIKVVGCGISGLSTAITLLEAGYSVEIISEKLPEDTTSAVAAAIWLPYEVNPIEKANRWSKESYFKYLELCDLPETGISLVSLMVLVEKKEDAWWLDALPQGEIREAREEELPAGFTLGFVLQVPLIETPVFLQYLLHQFEKLGGVLTKLKIENLAKITNKNTTVINCTGLASRELVNDKLLYPIYGQIVKTEPSNEILPIISEIPEGEKGELLAYIIPRKDCIVLGGTAIRGKEDLQPSESITRGILDRCETILPAIGQLKIKSSVVGLRPGRSEIRLEQEGQIIHNYGHGGAGFTVCWGCAEEVKKLVQEA